MADHRIIAVDRDGMVDLHDMGGWFAPHLFAVADDIGGIPPTATTADDWQPIDTAPRDGTEVRVIVEAFASWQKGEPSILMAPGWKLNLSTAKALRWRSQ